jgi:hypothetical protein
MSDPQDTAAAKPPEAPPDTPQAAPQPVPAKPAGEPIDAADMAGIARVVVGKAKDGDMRAAEVARKTWRWPQQAVRLELPPVSDAASLAEAHGAVIATAAAGKLTTRQALDFSTMLEYRRRAVETFEIEAKINALYAEKRKAAGDKR